MLKCMITNDNQTMMFIGLDDENIKRLTNDRPILVGKEAMNLPFDVCVMHGTTLTNVVDKMVEAFDLDKDTTELLHTAALHASPTNED